MFMVIDAACAVIRDMGTFAEAGIGDEYLENIRGEECFRTVEMKRNGELV